MLTGGRPPGSLYTSAGQRKYLTSAERLRFLERCLLRVRAPISGRYA